MRALDLNVDEEREHISQQALDEYVQCFKQPLPEAVSATDLVECIA
jgi:hypothetical protein